MREAKDPDRAADGCDFCADAAAVVYCRADSARLCLSCDRHVHAANSVCSRHHRALLCDACRAAPAAFLCSAPPHRLLLCSNCDFDAHAHAHSPPSRRSLDPFSGCPSALDLASLFGLTADVKSPPPPPPAAADDGWPFAEEAWGWDTTAVFSMEDLIVPTTSFHGFQATGILPPPKNRDETCGKQKDEILRQLRELVESESQLNDEGGDLVKSGSCLVDEGGEVGVDVKVEPVAAPAVKLREENLRSGFDLESWSMVVPTLEVNAPQWNHSNNCDVDVSGKVVFTYEQLSGSSSTVNASFVDEGIDVYATANHATCSDGIQGHPVGNENITSVPPKGVLELCPNRESVISRYKQKRKTRRYDKLIRYESRKTRADSRVRIKGRFAKTSQTKDT